ncbi:MAG: hypothetical protein MJE63_14940 [Proteobacteria bacterium]|nr:hypothetical protein [Pseudomonadota bacterium]
MKNIIKIFCVSILFLIGFNWQIQSFNHTAWAQTGDSADLDLGGEDDPFAEGEDDPLGGEAELDLDADIADVDEEPEFKIRTTINQELSLILAHSANDTGGITQDEDNDKETNSYISYNYQSQIKIQTTPYRYYFLRIISSFTQKYNEENENYSDDYTFYLREGYVNSQSGSLRYRLGAQIFKFGKVDYDSPLDALNMKNQSLLDLLETDEYKDPALALKADWLGDIQTLSFYLAPFRQKTTGTEYTIFQEQAEEEESDEEPEDRSVLRPHAGLTYQLSFEYVDIRIGAFQWFDQDNTITWQDATASVDYSQTYEEEDSTVQFGSFEIDATIGGLVFKIDVARFVDKNVYDYFKQSDGSSYFETVQVNHGAGAISIEKKFDSFFIMPVYSYRILYDVTADTHILGYENEEEPLTEERDLEKRQVSLILAWDITDRLQVYLVGSSTSPFKQDAATSIWTYRSGNRKHYFQFKMHYSVSEKLKMTDKKAETKRAALKYIYKF